MDARHTIRVMAGLVPAIHVLGAAAKKDVAGLVPAIHVLGAAAKEDVDARDKPGHDEQWCAEYEHRFALSPAA